MTVRRPSGRAPGALREVEIVRGFTKHAAGSVLIAFGDTRVLCTASVEERVPPFLRGSGRGWITSEYGMLPGSTHTRTDREAARGKQGGRTVEIQRLIGRSLRAAVRPRQAGANAPSASIATSCRPMGARAPHRSPVAAWPWWTPLNRGGAGGVCRTGGFRIGGGLPGGPGARPGLPRGLQRRHGHERGDDRGPRVSSRSRASAEGAPFGRATRSAEMLALAQGGIEALFAGATSRARNVTMDT